MSARSERQHFFSNRQVTAMVISLMAMVVLLPTTVWAVNVYTNVAVVDPIDGHKARVDSTGKLNVGDGAGDLTVDGIVTARPAAPADFRNFYIFTRAGCNVLVPTPPAGEAIVLQNINVETNRLSTPHPTHTFDIFRGQNCALSEIVGVVTPSGLGHTGFPLNPGIVSTTGFSVAESGDIAGDITATGYRIPSTGITAMAAGATVNSNRQP